MIFAAFDVPGRRNTDSHRYDSEDGLGDPHVGFELSRTSR